MMNRRDVLRVALATAALAATDGVHATSDSSRPLEPPTNGKISVAFLISEGAQVIDFAGPWEVFQDTELPERGATTDEAAPFDLFTVAETTKRIRATGGVQIIPDYDFRSAPQPKLIVVPAQSSPTEKTKANLVPDGIRGRQMDDWTYPAPWFGGEPLVVFSHLKGSIVIALRT